MATARRTAERGRAAWSSVAFIVESMLLLVFLVGSLALLTRLFSSSLNQSVESRTLDAATIAATSIAEHFAADPTGVQETTELGDLLITCAVTEHQREAGVLYVADIDVMDKATGEGIYRISTSRYESGVE